MKEVRNKQLFGYLPDGQQIDLFTLQNDGGMKVSLINYGGIITSLEIPDRHGVPGDVVLGFETLDEYLGAHPYFGALIGRYGNRIANGRFTLDSEEYVLARNLGNHHLHGGNEGFDKKFWEIEWLENKNGVQLSYTSNHMEEGYPGNLTVIVEYILEEENTLTIRYRAHTDSPTVLNLTQHTYFNLNGAARDIHDHVAHFRASRFLEVDSELIPTGNILPVTDTPLDFSVPHAIGERIDQDDPQLVRAGGYDHCYVVDPAESFVAEVYDPVSGRVMRMHTSEPAFQFYTGNAMDDSLTGKGKKYGHRMGLCLETQHYPDAPNHPEFPSTRLDKDQTYYSETRYAFSVRP